MKRQPAKRKPTYDELCVAFILAKTKRQRDRICLQMLDTPEGLQMEDEANSEYYEQVLLKTRAVGSVQ